MADATPTKTIPLGSALSSRNAFTEFALQPDWEVEADAASGEHVRKAMAWASQARDDQLPPDGDWTTWLMLAGRGAGKTRAGAEWVKAAALGLSPFKAPLQRIALVGETIADVRDVMIAGDSGLLGIHPPSIRPRWIGSKRQLVWENGAVALAFSSEDPESLRGPPASSGEGSDACGIVAAGVAADGVGYVLCDATAERLSPARWAKRAVDLFHKLEADRIVAEVNQGGEMVEAVIRQADSDVPVETVRASRGKFLRAEPVAALYEQGRVRHVGAFPELEDEMCDFALGGLSSGRSPDRLDALVWALSALMLTKEGKPRVRGI